MTELEQAFTALAGREKMRFLRWAAESVGARLDTVFTPSDLPVNGGTGASSLKDAQADAKLAQNEEMDIPESLRR